MQARKLIVTAFAALSLAACGGTDYANLPEGPAAATSASAPAPAPETTTQAPAPVATQVPAMSDEDLFVALLEQQGLIPTYGTAADHVALAGLMCDTLDQGYSFMEVTDVLVASGYTDYDAGFFYGVATAAYCTEYSI